MNNLWNRFLVGIGVFLAVFGIMNFSELAFGWKNRTEQFTRYLGKTVGPLFDLDVQQAVLPTLWAMKSIELVLGLSAVVGTLAAISGNTGRASRWLAFTIGGWMLAFTGMSFMDVWAADRAELQEHTLYFVGFAMLLLVVAATPLASRLAQFLPILEAMNIPVQRRGGDGHGHQAGRAPDGVAATKSP